MNNLASELLKVARLVASVSGLKLEHRNRGYHDNQSDNSIVAIVDGEVAGFLDYSEYRGEIHVQMIEVDKNFRRQGIGTALLKELDKEYPEVEIEYGMETADGARLIEEYQRRYPKKLDFERGFSNRDFVLSFVPDFGKNAGQRSWLDVSFSFYKTGLDLLDYDFNWEPHKKKFEQDIKRVTDKGWAAAAKQLRSDLHIKHNAEMKVAKMGSRQASEVVGPGDSELAFELSVEIPRTDKVLRATFSKSFRKGPPAMLKAISKLEEPYVTLRRQSRWHDGNLEPWKEVSVNDAKQLIILGKKLRKDLSKLLRDNKIAADQQYDTDYLPQRPISPDNKLEMPTLGEEPVSEITHCQHSGNPMERGKHLMMAREILKVAKDLLAMDTPEWVSPAFVSQLDIAGTNLKKYSASYRGVQTWALQSKSKIYKDQYGWVSALWTINPALDGQNWVIESALSFAPATSGSFANQKFAEFKDTVTIAGKKDLAMFGAERHVLTVKPDETNALREVNGVIAQHRDSFNAAKKFWKNVK